MATKPTTSTFPWYKERLQTKYPSTKISSVATCCRFANTNLDDFSDCSAIFFHSDPREKASQKPQRRVSKEHACFSRQMSQKQTRREYVAAVEEKLQQHPLAIYPHYKDHMSPELFDKVVSVLDPDMGINSSPALPPGDHVEEEEEENCPEPRTGKPISNII